MYLGRRVSAARRGGRVHAGRSRRGIPVGASAAAVATLATFWLGTIWYFVGRGLSEVAAAGWGFIGVAAAAPAPARRHRASPLLAGVFAVLMFYTRLNHLFFAVVPARADRRRLTVRSAAAYRRDVLLPAWRCLPRARGGTRACFSILYGTSLKNNDTGLRLTTVFDAPVWWRRSGTACARSSG